MSATELVEHYRAGSLSPVEVTRAVLSQIARHGEAINAFVLVDEERALDAARASEGRWRTGEPHGLIDGVPTTIKDLILTKGWPTLRGSLAINPDQPWDEDAPVAARLREHGAVLLGKTATPEFGHKGVTDSPVSGITRNPWNLDKTPGGSSGGASAAVAAGMGPLAIGTDGGGSIRIPASFAGIFGIKPTFGRVPAYPASPFGSVAHVGPMTRTVADAALMLTVIAGPDVRDWTALPYDEEDYRRNLDQPLSGVRVAYSETLGMPDVRLDPEVRDCVATAARSFQSLGATVIEADPVWPHEPGAVFNVYWSIGAAKLIDDMTDDQVAKMEDSLTVFAAAGRKLSGLDIKVAELQRTANGVALNRFFEDYDLLLSPTMPIPAFNAGAPVPSDDYADEPLRWTPYTFPINLAKNPAASVPCGFTGAGLPVGLHVIGPMYREVSVLRAARAYEQAHDWFSRRPALVKGA
jgi:aspartyl-tRNA(Asn)/glutamyl-tRNA(Gln) amidotransferase subunit A